MRRLIVSGVSTRLLASVSLLFGAASAVSQPNLPVFTSPIDITGGRLSITAYAPDRDSGLMVQQIVPSPTFGPTMTALTASPLNVVLDSRWNGTAAQRTAGTSPRQLACDGPSGVKAIIAERAASKSETAYEVVCNFGSSGQVFVKDVPHALYMSYQIFNNTVTFRTTSPLSCDRSHGNVICPNDPKFEVRFAFEMLTVIWTPSICALRAEPPTVYLHAVEFDSHNAAADVAMFWDAVFQDNGFMAGELAAEARESNAPISLDGAFNEVRSSPACMGPGPDARLLQPFSQLDTYINLPQGIELRAVHPPIGIPRILNVSLPFGEDTCKPTFVFREAFPGDHVCVQPQTRDQAAVDNTQATAHRLPSPTPVPNYTCIAGYVWREARAGDRVCVKPETRAQTASDNAAATSHRVVQPSSTPSFTRPSLNVPPVVAAGANFTVSGRFFPVSSDPTITHLLIDRDTTSACNGGATELETTAGAGAAQKNRLTADPGSMSFCTYRYSAGPLQTSTNYRFRIRDCDYITCSAWSVPFITLTGTPSAGPGPVVITLDTGVNLGSITADAAGSFNKSVTMPGDTLPGSHSISGSSGGSVDTTTIQVNGNVANAQILLTGAFYGDQGCPMRPAPNTISAGEQFPMFGSGFGSGLVLIKLDSENGASLGSIYPQSNGTFCGYFSGPSSTLTGSHTLVASQGGAVRARLPVQIVIINPIH